MTNRHHRLLALAALLAVALAPALAWGQTAADKTIFVTMDRSSKEPRKIQESLSRSRAQLWTISLEKNQAKQDKVSQRDVILNAMTQATGGRREFISAESAIERYMKMYADALLSQYAVTYKRPGADRPKVVQTGLTRNGPLKLHSGLFPPQ